VPAPRKGKKELAATPDGDVVDMSGALHMVAVEEHEEDSAESAPQWLTNVINICMEKNACDFNFVWQALKACGWKCIDNR
jgi:hypothetical protein